MNKLILLMCLLPFLAYAQNQDLEANKYILARVNDLERQIDSLKQVNENNELKYKASEKLEIITKVNEFYDSAWTKLLIVGTLIGLLAPYLINLLQSRDLKILKTKLSSELKDEFSKHLLDVNNGIDSRLQEINKKFKEHEDKIEESSMNAIHTAEGHYYFQTGITAMNENKPLYAARIFLYASLTWEDAKVYYRVKSSLNLLNSQLEILNNEDLVRFIDDVKISGYKEPIDYYIRRLNESEGLSEIEESLGKLKNILKDFI